MKKISKNILKSAGKAWHHSYIHGLLEHTLLGYVFNFGLAIAVVLALVMIIWGGIEYMTTDSWEGKNDGKTRIQNALYGLGLALASYLILYTINPCLVQFVPTPGGCTSTNTFLNPPAPSTTNTSNATQQTSNTGSIGGATVDASSIDSRLNSGISVWSSQGCYTNNTGCTI